MMRFIKDLTFVFVINIALFFGLIYLINASCKLDYLPIYYCEEPVTLVIITLVITLTSTIFGLYNLIKD